MMFVLVFVLVVIVIVIVALVVAVVVVVRVIAAIAVMVPTEMAGMVPMRLVVAIAAADSVLAGNIGALGLGGMEVVAVAAAVAVAVADTAGVHTCKVVHRHILVWTRARMRPPRCEWAQAARRHAARRW